MIGEQHLWGHQRTVYRDKNVWVVEIFGKEGGASSVHYHENMINLVMVRSGALQIDGAPRSPHILIPDDQMTFETEERHGLLFRKDTEAVEVYLALPGHEIDENDIVRLSPGRAPDAFPA